MQVKIEEGLVELAKKVKGWGSCLDAYAQIEGRETVLVESFEEMMGALEGLAGLVGQLAGEYHKFRDEIGEAERIRLMVGNHQKIIKDIQDDHSTQIGRIQEQH